MSLLLDALKKAAQEKQNADSVYSETDADGALRPAPVTEVPPKPPRQTEKDQLSLEELELDDDLDLQEIPDSEVIANPEEPVPSPVPVDQYIAPTPSTVSDEALRLLINKTNDAYRKSRIMTWGGVAAGAMVILSISGYYFYSSLIVEMDSMQRKHQIALATLKSKTRIEENLTSLAAVPEPDTRLRAEMRQASEGARRSNEATGLEAESGAAQQSEQVFTVQRADKRDPVSTALERGWQAYQSQDYDTSMRLYRRALKIEPENHDALLGVAAVSLQQNQIEVARDIYLKLLEKDPRDPHAHAGLANIAQSNGASLSEAKLKQLIEYRPDDSHLQFALGNLYVQKQSWPEAQQAFFNAWKGDSRNPDYAYNLAVSLDQLGKHKEARVFYEDSLKLAAGKNISFSTDAVKNRLAYLGTSE